MKFTDYDKEDQVKKKKLKTDWVADFDFDVSNLISEARLRKGLTQAQLAKLVGTQQPSIARVERGSSLPSLGFLKKIALAIDTSLLAPRFGFLAERGSSMVRVINRVEERPFPVYIRSESLSTRTVQSEINAY